MRIESGRNGVENTEIKQSKDGAESRWGEIAEVPTMQGVEQLPFRAAGYFV
jgi:hypothetical protein